MKYVINRSYDPWNSLDSFFAPFFTEEPRTSSRRYMATDIEDKGDHYEMSVNLPGFDKKDVELSLEDGYLTISAATKSGDNSEESDNRFIRRERYYGTMSRTYYVGDIDEKMIKASFENGVLKISLPKEDKAEIEKKHAITID